MLPGESTGANINNVDGMVIGGHGDTTMIPLLSKASVNGVPVTQFASKKKLEELSPARWSAVPR